MRRRTPGGWRSGWEPPTWASPSWAASATSDRRPTPSHTRALPASPGASAMTMSGPAMIPNRAAPRVRNVQPAASSRKSGSRSRARRPRATSAVPARTIRKAAKPGSANGGDCHSAMAPRNGLPTCELIGRVRMSTPLGPTAKAAIATTLLMTQRHDRSARPGPPADADRDRDDERHEAGQERERAAAVDVDPDDRDERHDDERPDGATSQPQAPGEDGGEDEHHVPALCPRAPDGQPEDDAERHEQGPRERRDARGHEPEQPPRQADREGRDGQRDEARAHEAGRPVGRGQDHVPCPAVREERLTAGQPAEDVGLRDDPGREDRVADPQVPAEVRVRLRSPGRDPRADQDHGRDRPPEQPIVAEQDGQAVGDSAGSVGRHLREMVGHARSDALSSVR